MQLPSSMVDYGIFQRSLLRLKEQQEHLLGDDPAWTDLVRDGIAESVIHRFETCYDCLWKSLRRYLAEELGIADVPSSPKPLFRMAAANGLLSSPFEKWNEYANARIDTSHDYNEDKARACLALIDDFIDDAIGLYQTITGTTWE